MASLITVRINKGDSPNLGFRLQGGKDFGTPLVVQKVSRNLFLFLFIYFLACMKYGLFRKNSRTLIITRFLIYKLELHSSVELLVAFIFRFVYFCQVCK